MISHMNHQTATDSKRRLATKPKAQDEPDHSLTARGDDVLNRSPSCVRRSRLRFITSRMSKRGIFDILCGNNGIVAQLDRATVS